MATALLVVCLLIPVSYVWVTPPRTSFMLQNNGPVVYQYVSLDHVSRYMIASTIAHEDQLLGARKGAFDYDDFKNRIQAFADGEADPSGSTIPQQLAKNIFFSADQNAVRKGLEAVVATEFSYTLSDQRIMELYLNYAQFGPTIYGICAATWYYFNTPPSAMTEYQAAQLAGILPFPATVARDVNGGIRATPEILREANERVPWLIAGLGGWEAAVATIGIHDSASDHASTRGASNGCSTMPKDVAKLLAGK
ncbi:transglycosylase domain-containing protein [Arthrobacter psychrolactophilus]|nr:transglycosylase domain-containing protein [Arthrobacter psychrolactophilus]